MSYKLFLDDERYPVDNSPVWRIARSYDDAKWMVEAYGMPQFISFDHDLGPGGWNGYDFAKWFVAWVIANDASVDNFTFDVHSMNVVGAANISYYMKNFVDARLKGVV